jgi:hypothetical protein
MIRIQFYFVHFEYATETRLTVIILLFAVSKSLVITLDRFLTRLIVTIE